MGYAAISQLETWLDDTQNNEDRQGKNCVELQVRHRG